MTTRLVVLLRGINVGGNKLVDMSRLRGLLTEVGYGDVETYLQSGNAIVTAGTATTATAAGQIEDAIAGEFGFECRVVVRTASELAAAMAADPLLHLLGNPSRHMVGFLSDPPDAAGVEQLTAEDYGSDQLRIEDQHLYLWCPNGITGSPFGKLNFDRILGVAVTTRNWNTVTKLASRAGI
ncbi:MAG TPA: DUF1697 domain-containing protein [Acidimicrobiales bacterium]